MGDRAYKKQKDTDLFPKLKEYDYLFEDEDYLVAKVLEIDIENYVWQPYRRFIIPKDEYSYRAAIQLEPIDNLIMIAITYQFGQRIEDKRVSITENKVFNDRFSPKPDGELYDKKEAWKNFWTVSKEKSKEYNYAVYIDVADFYNALKINANAVSYRLSRKDIILTWKMKLKSETVQLISLYLHVMRERMELKYVFRITMSG